MDFGIGRTRPRTVPVRDEFLGKVRQYVAKDFGDDWGKCYEAWGRGHDGNKMTRGMLVMMLERVDPNYVAKSWGVVSHLIDVLDVDRDGFIELEEFVKLNA